MKGRSALHIRQRQRMQAAAIAVCCAPVLAGCEPYRIEYHQRPGFYYEASEVELHDEWTAPDGTLVKFSQDRLPSHEAALAAQLEKKEPVDRDGDGEPDPYEPTPLWEEREDGSVIMRAFLPQHIVGNLMRALREERYGEFYDQQLSEQARRSFDNEAGGSGKQAFARWCARHRRSLMETLNRMMFGYMKSDVILRKIGANGYRLDFTPNLAQQFKFTTVDVSYRGTEVKLDGIGTRGGNGGVDPSSYRRRR